MASRIILYLSLLALCLLVSIVTMADAEDAATNTGLQHEVGRRSLAEVLHLEKRAAGDGEAGNTETGKRRRRPGKKGRGKRKGKGRGKGNRKADKGTPVYEACVHPSGTTCTCDMRYKKFRNHPVKQSKFYTVC